MRISTRLVLLFCALSSRAFAQVNINDPVLSVEQQNAIVSIAHDIQSKMDKSRCNGTPCEILITNFLVEPPGQTCVSCLVLSDAIAKAMAEYSATSHVISRSRLYSFLEQERIPSRLFGQREALKWLAGEFHATHLIFGTVRQKKEVLELEVQVRRFEGMGGGTSTSKKVSTRFLASNLAGGLEPREPFGLLPPRTTTQKGEALYKLGNASAGLTPPRCTFMPNPRYTQAAREAMISGAVLLEAVVTVQGTLEGLRVARGLPFGLNQETLDTAKTWRCNPAQKDGRAVPALVPFEVNFRLY